MNDTPTPKSPTQALAELVARRKALAGQGPKHAYPGAKQSERAASAKSASKSKPAMGK
ncbi:MAG TPA: hypothetical protein VL460_07285 [Caulobacteraceae bacterium]|jgi:hypothetical protein|nr:hypothetical protein [Caulobacteraceae bacterium]